MRWEDPEGKEAKHEMMREMNKEEKICLTCLPFLSRNSIVSFFIFLWLQEEFCSFLSFETRGIFHSCLLDWFSSYSSRVSFVWITCQDLPPHSFLLCHHFVWLSVPSFLLLFQILHQTLLLHHLLICLLTLFVFQIQSRLYSLSYFIS